MHNDKTLEFCGELKRETDRAFLIFDGINEVWIPKSQIKEKHQIGRPDSADWSFQIPEWLAIEKGII